MAKRKGPQSDQWVTLRDNNVGHVADITGKDKHELKRLLRNAKDKGIYELQIPLNTPIFTREER